MERCEHYTLDCQAEKMGCEGCGYYKKSADEMLEELGYLKTAGETTEVFRLKNRSKAIYFSNLIKRIKIDGTDTFIDVQELEAINKKVEELGWK